MARAGTALGGIIYHSPLVCPVCTHCFQGTWTSCTDKEHQACPACGEAWPEAWAGWVFLPECDRGRPVPLGDRDRLFGCPDGESLRG